MLSETVRLYDYPASGHCFKVRLLLRLARIDCEVVAVDIFAGDSLTQEYARLNPLRQTPVLQLADGRTLTQSGAILTFLASGTRWLPDDPLRRAEVVSWLLTEQEHIGAIAGARFVIATGRASDNEARVAEQLEAGRAALDTVDAHLSGQDWLVGDAPTIADIACFAYLSRAGEAGLGLAHWCGVSSWLDRVRALDGFYDDLAPYPASALRQTGRSIYG